MYNFTRTTIVACLIASCFPALLASAQEPRAQRGRVFAQTNCAMCHSIGRTGDSPLVSHRRSALCVSATRLMIWRSRSPKELGQAIRPCRSFNLIPRRSEISSRILRRLNRHSPLRFPLTSARPGRSPPISSLSSTFDDFVWAHDRPTRAVNQ